MSDIKSNRSECFEPSVFCGGDRSIEPSPEAQLSWLRLIRDRRWSASQKRQLLEVLGFPEAIYALPLNESLSLITGRISPKRAAPWVATEDELQRDIAWLNEDNHHLITLNDPQYSMLLRQISDPPIALFAVGDINLMSEPGVAIVGSRRPTPVGAKVAGQIASDISDLGIVVTSGMALGIDGIAHQAALEFDRPTIAVMGCGLDTVYPARNRSLFEQISEHGLLLSEYPLGVPVSKYTFPQRNRIVSGLCYGVVIVEAAERSGTLITARLATEQDREVMVVPGSSVSAQYQGSHRLLQQGAALVLSGLDVVQTLSIELASELRSDNTPDKGPATQKFVDQDFDSSPSDNAPPENALLNFISVESTMVDTVILESGLTAAEVSAMLLLLELRGLIAMADDGGYLNIS